MSDDSSTRYYVKVVVAAALVPLAVCGAGPLAAYGAYNVGALAANGAYNVAYGAYNLCRKTTMKVCKTITKTMEMKEDAVMIITKLRDEARMSKEARMREEEEEEKEEEEANYVTVEPQA
ncbi:hypothetical protein CCACVL1_26711 [Corchorus capsularis]|uniref:Uncharacterized protein n=1 Tax=Corchorus capsularis TaxID=210143 RepID=A0A1R3GDP1_COCAP|nr:hypothetical protein CCACVL1_26711 [Corchorus capsularis]